MKKQHRLLSLFLALAMILTFMPAMAFADDSVPTPEPAKISIRATNAQSVIDPVEPVELAFENDANAVFNVKASRLVRSGWGQNQNISFTLRAVDGGGWENARVTDQDGVEKCNTFNTGDEPTLTIAIADLATTYKNAYVWTFKQGEVEGTLTINFDFTKTDVFTSTNSGYDDEYFADADNMIKWSNGTEFSTEQDPWRIMKAEEAAAKFMNEYNAAVQAQKDADASKTAAEEAMKTPGDAAVAAAQKALDDAKKAEQAAKNLGAVLDEKIYDTIDELYIDNAGDLTPYAAALKDAELNIATYYNYAELEKAVDKAEIKLSEAKADAATAEVNALKYTPEKTKITSVKKGKKKATVSFKKVAKNVTGYEIVVTNKKTGEVKTVYAKKSSKKTIKKVVKGLKRKTKYSVKVRAYNTVGAKTYYAPWSKAKGFKTK